MKKLFLFFFYVIGIVISSLGLALIIKSGLGVGPGDSVAVGLSLHLPVTVGSVLIVSFIILVLINARIEKKRPQYESIVPIVIRGVTLDFFLYVLLKNADFELWWSQWAIFSLGLLGLSAGISLYLRTPFPRIPVDHFMMIVNEKTNHSKRIVRILFESFLAIIGWMLGAPVGIGTLLVAITLGPIIQWFYDLFKPIQKYWGYILKNNMDQT